MNRRWVWIGVGLLAVAGGVGLFWERAPQPAPAAAVQHPPKKRTPPKASSGHTTPVKPPVLSAATAPVLPKAMPSTLPPPQAARLTPEEHRIRDGLIEKAEVESPEGWERVRTDPVALARAWLVKIQLYETAQGPQLSRWMGAYVSASKVVEPARIRPRPQEGGPASDVEFLAAAAKDPTLTQEEQALVAGVAAALPAYLDDWAVERGE